MSTTNPGPWQNFGLLLGDEEPNNENVVVMTEEIYRALPDDVFNLTSKPEGFTEVQRASIWRMLNRDGPVPKIHLVVRGTAIEKALERVQKEEEAEAEAKRPLVDRVQERLDSYKTNKQRVKRVRALSLLIDDNDGYGEIAWIMEYEALKIRLEEKRKITAREIQSLIYRIVRSGQVPLTVSIGGERVTVPQEVINRSPPPDGE